MLNPLPVWIFRSRKPLKQWYGHVHLLPNRVLGQWVCLERGSGKLQWQRKFYRPNTYTGVDSGVIVASEMRSDGPWTFDFGCYGLSLETGRLLWTSHGSGIAGVLSRMLDFIPGFTNELRDSPQRVENGLVYCNSGRILDVKTGGLVKKIPRKEVPPLELPASVSQSFYDSQTGKTTTKVACGADLFLRHERNREEFHRDLKIVAESKTGDVLWSFSTEVLGRKVDGNFYSYRLVPPFLYLIVSDEPRYQPHPTQQHCILPNPTRWHFVTLKLSTGEVLQDFSLGHEKFAECRIEDIDEQGLLIGRSDHSLMYFLRDPSAQTEMSVPPAPANSAVRL